ncbi:MAG: DNA polymerase III subunit chi [Methylophilaceae bacterium]|nr:MAG: DNA polymerase III subunit chi [Methylophilaceae bacterium]
MTRVIFYSNLTDKQVALQTLVQQALAKKHVVTVMVESELQARDYGKALWQSNETNFLPNVLAPDALANETPVVLDWQENQLCQDDILINLSQKQLTTFSRFRQLIELVGLDESDKVLARQRYKFYRDRGYEIRHFDEKDLIH